MWVSTVVFSVVFPGPEFAWGCAPVPRADRLCAWLCTVRGVLAGSVQRVCSVLSVIERVGYHSCCVCLI